MDHRGKNLVIIALILLVLVLGSYIVYSMFFEVSMTGGTVNDLPREYNLDNPEDAFEVGYKTAVVEIIEKAEDCYQVPLVIGDKTIYVAEVNCLQDLCSQ